MNDGDPGRRVIDGRFELVTRLGGGGMGMVWRARDVVLDRSVALKEVRPPDPALAEYDPEAARLLRARVLREARALARVDHPNVVTIHHVVDGGEDTYPWLVMELVTGGSLADRLAKGPMAPVEAARLGREVLAALRAAHEAGIQHRDVKPANVLLRPDGRPVLTDFGIAAIRESTVLTATGSLIGTPDYMAPERISGDDGGPAADLWSLAMMLYVAVEGRHPLRRGTTLATLAAVLNDELPPPARAGVLTAVLNAVLVKDPAGRPDADALDRMLARAAGGRAPSPAAGDDPETSYRLRPPVAPSSAVLPQPQPQSQPQSQPPVGTPAPPPEQHSVRDAVPPSTPPAFGPGPWQPAPGTPAGGPARSERRARLSRRIAVGSSLAGTVLTGVLVWTWLPDGGGENTGKGDRSPSLSAGPSGTGEPAPTPTPSTPEKTEQVDLLTPDGIRTALAAIEKATGTNRLGSLTVYPEHVSVDVMVKGSESRKDSWTYRPGQGARKGIISGTLSGGDLPFTTDRFDWDVVPALLSRAEKDLGVKDPTSRYLLVDPANSTFDTPLGLAVHFADDYDGGHLTADLRGKVIDVYPADS